MKNISDDSQLPQQLQDMKKKRTRRACDICNLKRSRCDGGNPCSYCRQTNRPCTYLRAQKKRGRASEKYPKNPRRRKDAKNHAEPSELPTEAEDEELETKWSAEYSTTNSLTADIQTSYSDYGQNEYINRSSVDNSQSIIFKKGEFQSDSYRNKANNSNSSSDGQSISIDLSNSSVGSPRINNELRKNPSSDGSHRSSAAFLPTEYALNLNNYIFLIDENLFSTPTFLETLYNYSLIDGMNNDSITDSQFDGVRIVVLLRVLNYLKQVNLPGNVASDMLEYYFDEQVKPSCKISSIVRKRTMLMLVNPHMGIEEQLKHVRQTKDALILTMLTVACFDINHFFMTGHKRKLIFGQLIQVINSLVKIDPHDENIILDGTFDDVIMSAHLVCILPLLGNPAISHLWLRRGVNLAKKLELNKENMNISEEQREERRRCWWTLYILDKHLNVALNTSTIVKDHESQDLFHPCDDTMFNDITVENLQSPYEDDINRPRGICFNIFGPGIFGWMLPASMLVGSLMYYKSYTLNQRKIVGQNPGDLHENVQDWSENYKNQLRDHLAVFESNIPSLLQYSKVDYSYAQVVACVLTSLLNKDVFFWDPNGLLRENIDFEKDLNWCVQYSELFNDLISYDPDMRRYPFIIRAHIFFASIDAINMLGNIDKELVKYKKKPQSTTIKATADALTKLCHKVKSTVHIIVRCIESCMTTLPVDYLRVIRNCLMDALRDMDCLLLIKGFQKQFQANREKRKKILSVYSFVVNGRGIGL